VTSLWDLMRGAMATKALGVAADLDVAKELAAGPRSVGDLAQATGADPEGLLHDDARAFAHQFGSVFYDAVATLDPTTRA